MSEREPYGAPCGFDQARMATTSRYSDWIEVPPSLALLCADHESIPFLVEIHLAVPGAVHVFNLLSKPFSAFWLLSDLHICPRI
ncbi:MAG: hypothetical protein WAO55_15325, partial [Candidatus Manganitrophaceae bacterium]